MKRHIVVIVAILATTIFLSSDLIGGRGGRGGGGGGRGGGGGGRVSGGGGGGGAGVGDRGGGLGAGNVGPSVGHGGGGAVNARPAGPSKGPGPGGPSKGQLDNFLDVGGGKGGPGVGNPAGPAAVNDFFQKGPGTSDVGKRPAISTGPGVGKGPNVGAKAGQLPANRPGRVENKQQLAQQRTDRHQEIRNEFNDNHPRWDFASDHPRWANWRVNAPFRWATAAALTGWCGYGASSYYDYGDNIYYQDDAVYSDGQQIATAEEYAAAAEQIATSIPATKNPDWMSLGVFAITQDHQASGPTPTMFVQLNISKEGIIAGSFQNTATSTTQPIEGAVDKQSQRAAVVISGKTRPLLETGIYNLTKDSAPALLHFADGQSQQWLLVRLDEPKE